MAAQQIETAVATYLNAGLPYPTAVGAAMQRHSLTAVLGQEPTEAQAKEFSRLIDWGYLKHDDREGAVRYALTHFLGE